MLERKKWNADFSSAYALIERVISKLIDIHFSRQDCEQLDWFAIVDFTGDGRVVADLRATQLVRAANEMLLL